METTNIWNKLHLSGKKITLIFVLILLQYPLFAQGGGNRYGLNLVNYDERKLQFGFTIGVHTSALRLKYSEAFTGPDYEGVANIQSKNAFGFSLGFLTNYKLAQYLDAHFVPKVAFYDYALEVDRIENKNSILTEDAPFADFVVVDFPLLLKYKSQRRGNYRMFYVGGVTPTVDITGKKKKERAAEESSLRLNGNNVSAEVGFGVDIYYPYFKFSPEIRYSFGLMDVLENKANEVGRAFDRISTHSVSLYFVFN